MMRATTVRCPSCGAPVHPEEDGHFALCEYCGTKVLLEEDGAPGRETEAALTDSQRMYLNEYRFRVLCAIYAVCVSFVLIPDADSKSVLATVSVVLLFAGIVVWVKAGKKAKKIVS